MDILVEIPRNKWIQLQNLYTASWPKGAVAYCVLDTQISNENLNGVSNFKVYCPEGEITYGMIGTIDLFGYYQLLIHPLDDLEKVEEALLRTNIIDWNRGVVVPSASAEVVEILRRLQKHLEITIRYETNACKYLLNDNEPLFDLSVQPPDSYVAPLKHKDISFIDKKWMYHSETTNKFFELLIEQEMTYVLYSSKDDTPMAWIMVDVEGALTHLYTLEPYRRRGFGEFITKYAANDIRRRGRKVLAYTVQTNDKPQRMFNKLGFNLIGMDQWIFIRRVPLDSVPFL